MSSLKEDELLADDDGLLLKEDFDDDTLLLGGEDDLLGTEDPSGPQENILEEDDPPPQAICASEAASETVSADPELEVKPETNTVAEEPCSESDDDGGGVQVVVNQERIRERDRDDDDEEEAQNSGRSRFQQERVISTRGGKNRNGIFDSLENVEIPNLSNQHQSGAAGNRSNRARGGRFRHERPRPYLPRMVRDGPPRPRHTRPLLQRVHGYPPHPGPVPPPPVPPNFPNIPPPNFMPPPNGMPLPPRMPFPPQAPIPPLLPPPTMNILPPVFPMPPAHNMPPSFPPPLPNIHPPTIISVPPPMVRPQPAPMVMAAQHKGQKIYINKNFRPPPSSMGAYPAMFDPTVPPPMIGTHQGGYGSPPTAWRSPPRHRGLQRSRDRSRSREREWRNRRGPREHSRERDHPRDDRDYHPRDHHRERRTSREDYSTKPTKQPDEYELQVLQQKREREKILKMKEERRRQAAREKLNNDQQQQQGLQSHDQETKEQKQSRQVILHRIEDQLDERTLKIAFNNYLIERIRIIREKHAAFVFFRNPLDAADFCRSNPKFTLEERMRQRGRERVRHMEREVREQRNKPDLRRRKNYEGYRSADRFER